MRQLFALSMFFFSGLALAATFASRVDAGNAALATPEGKKYDASLAPAIQSALAACPPSNLGKFSLVANVDASGHLSDVAIEPGTETSTCFLTRFVTAVLPTPPAALTRKSFPITVTITVAP